MIVVFDLGNSDLSFGVFKDDHLIASFRTSSDRRRSVDEYANIIRGLLFSKGVNAEKVEGTILSSVVPQLSKVLSSAIKRAFGKETMLLGPGCKTGLKIRADNPNEVGSDLVAVCVGAMKHYKLPIVIVDFGTATKILGINSSGLYCGVAILPGVKSSAEGLVNIASQLPHISLVKPKKVLGTNTVDAMNSGLVYGNASMADGMIRKYEREMGEKCTRLLTGGLASTISVAMEEEHILDKNLVLYGLFEIFQRNRK